MNAYLISHSATYVHLTFSRTHMSETLLIQSVQCFLVPTRFEDALPKQQGFPGGFDPQTWNQRHRGFRTVVISS